MSEENNQKASELSKRIEALDALNGESLKGEMAALKVAILENPAASALLLDEDVGLLVKALRKMTGVALTNAAAGKEKVKKPSTKAVKLSATDLMEGAEEL